MTSITQAKQAYYNLAKDWLCNERDGYEDEHDCEDVDEIPIDKLEDGNYKDLRVLEDYFYYKEDEPTKEVTLCGLNEEQVQKLKQSYESLNELVFMGGNKSCAASDEFTSRMQCCAECDTWYDIDDKDDNGKPMIIEEDGDYMCHHCYKEFHYSVEEHNDDGFTTEIFVTEEDARVYFDNLGKVRKELLKVYKDNSDNDERLDSYDPHGCGVFGGIIRGMEGCGELFDMYDTNMLGNTSFCIPCYEKYEEKYYEEEEEEEEIDIPDDGYSKCPDCDNIYTNANIDSGRVVPCARCYKCYVGCCGNTRCECVFSDDDSEDIRDS
jgi:hypothetical protein